MLTATNIRSTNASLFIPAQTGCPIKDSADHSKKLGLHRLDYEAFSVQGARVYRQVAADGNAAEARQSWISTQSFHDKTFAKANATEKSLGEGFLQLLNQILADTDAQYKREVASHYYQQLLNGVGNKITVLLNVLAELQAIATAIAPDTTDRKETFDSLGIVLSQQVGEALAYQMVSTLVTLTAELSDERCEALVCAELKELHRAKNQPAHITELEAYAQEQASFEPLEQSRLGESHGNGGQIRTGVAVFDQEVAEKQQMLRRTGTTSFTDSYYFDRHISDLLDQSQLGESSHDQLHVALAQRGQWDDSLPMNQAYEFAGHLEEFDETSLPAELEGLRTEAARWFCFLQPSWTPWSREEAGHAIRAYAQAHHLTAREAQNLRAVCPKSYTTIQRTDSKKLQAVMIWAEHTQFKMRLSVEQVSQRVWSLLNQYTSEKDHTDFIIEDGIVTETSERTERLAQQTSALIAELQADKHLTWMRHNSTYRELHSGLAKATSVADANKLITEAYAITQMGKENPDTKRLSVAQLAALKTRKEITVARIKRNPSAPARALLAQADKLAVGSNIQESQMGNNFITMMNTLPLHEQDTVIAKLRARQIRVIASDTCKSLLAEIRGAHQVVAANGKGNWLKGIKWACYEKNAPNTEYLQGVNQRYKTLPRYEQTAVWQHLNA